MDDVEHHQHDTLQCHWEWASSPSVQFNSQCAFQDASVAEANAPILYPHLPSTNHKKSLIFGISKTPYGCFVPTKQTKGKSIVAHDPARGKRVREAISRRQIRKVHALAAELNVSVAAVSRWQNGGHTSLESACALARLLDISLDWLLLGRGTMDWHKDSSISQTELQWVLALRSRPAIIRSRLIDLVEAIPPEHPLR